MLTGSPLDVFPPLIVLVCAILYLLFKLVKTQWLTILAAGIGIFLALFVLLPSGRDILDQARNLPTTTQKMTCFVTSIGHGAPFAPAVNKTPECHFVGHGIDL